jgi:ribose transport system ATP-binding protein
MNRPGIDMGAPSRYLRNNTDLAKSGTAVVVVSSDLEEVMGLSHRVLVPACGRNQGILEGSQITNVPS